MLANTLTADRPVNEELAGPPVPFAPAQRAERISAIDVLRGFALMGILVLNINDFGSVELTHDIPTLNSLYGPHGGLNFAVLLIKWMFFEGKVRGIFSMLFGAGVMLLTTRAEKRGAAASVADIYTRRNMLLTLFGLLHGIFIWDGDILFDYGLNALLFLYPARKLKASFLIIAGILLSLTLGTLGVMGFTKSGSDVFLSRQVKAVQQRQRDHQPLTPADSAVEKQWQAAVENHTVTPAKLSEDLAEGRAGYRMHVEENLSLYFGKKVIIHVYGIGDAVSAMLLGMGLFKVGFLTAEMSDSVYLLTILCGFALSLPLYLYAFLSAYHSHFDFLVLDKWVWIPYEFTRTAGMLALTAVVMLLVKRGVFRTPQRWFAAVGKTALSNYIGTSLLCQFVFLWGPWKLYGKLEYYQLMYVVFGVWVVNMVSSTLWLRYFEFGPLEWVWRSLTYGKAQPMRLPKSTS